MGEETCKAEEQPNQAHPIGCVTRGTPTGETLERGPTPVGPEWEAQLLTKGDVAIDPSNLVGQKEDLWDYDLGGQLIFEVVNITSAITNRDQTLERKAKIVAIQEHSVEGKEAADFKQRATDAGREMVLWAIRPGTCQKNGRCRVQSQKGIVAHAYKS